MSVTVLLEVQSKPEDLEALKTTFRDTLPDTRVYEGCHGVEVIGNQDDACNLILVEKWESRTHYEKYLGWRTETGALENLVKMLTQPPIIRYYENLDI